MELEAPPLKMDLSFNSSDYVFADQLLNLPNEEEEQQQQQINPNSPVSAPLQLEFEAISTSNSSQPDFFFVSSSDFEDLDWLSHLVADSTPDQYPAPPPIHEFGRSNLNTPFPSKPRTKRPKISRRVWSFTASISDKPKHGLGKIQPSRRCAHCGVLKTPQWRAGPLGARTLCNACGVRFKSGRLFPEYRPACSPSFSSGIHSNHHRKVLEMRREKGAEKVETPHSGMD